MQWLPFDENKLQLNNATAIVTNIEIGNLNVVAKIKNKHILLCISRLKMYLFFGKGDVFAWGIPPLKNCNLL